MAGDSKPCRIICLNESVAVSLREAGLDVVSNMESALCDFAPAFYVHAPERVTAIPYTKDRSEWRQIEGRFIHALMDAHQPPPSGIGYDSVVPEDLQECVAEGLVNVLVFVEKVATDRRLDEFASMLRTQNDAEPPIDSPPVLEYNARLFEGILPTGSFVWDPEPRVCLEEPPCPVKIIQLHPQAPQWAQYLLPQCADRVDVRLEFPSNLSAAVSNMYFYKEGCEDLVEIVPLLVDRLSRELGIAVRVAKGMILALPECRDKAAKAETVRLLSGELWQPIQTWLSERRGRLARSGAGKGTESTPEAGASRTHANDDLLESILKLVDALERGRGMLTPPIRELAHDLASGVVGWYGCTETHLKEWSEGGKNETAADKMHLELHYLTCIENILSAIDYGESRCRVSSITPLREFVRALEELERKPSPTGTAQPPGSAPGPRWYMMRPFKNWGYALVVRPGHNPYNYWLSDTDIQELKRWIPNFAPGGPFLGKLYAALVSQCGVSPSGCEDLPWPGVISILRAHSPPATEQLPDRTDSPKKPADPSSAPPTIERPEDPLAVIRDAATVGNAADALPDGQADPGAGAGPPALSPIPPGTDPTRKDRPMSLSEEFRANYGEIAQEVHEFVVLPGVKARFLGFRQAYRRPTEGLFHKDKNGEILLSDQYVWLGVVHDMCLPTFAISPEDAGDEITDETTDVLAGIIAPLSLGVLDGVEAEACLRGFLARVKDDLAEAEAQDAGTAAARAQGGAGGARGSVTHETPLPLGPRWYMMRPFKDRGRAMVVKPRMNPWDYHLDDDGAAVIRCWLPDFDPDHADLPGLEALLMTRFGVSPNNCQELTWPQIIGLLRVKGSTLPAEGPVGGPGEAAADSPRFTAVILPRDYKPSPSDDWSIPMSMAKIAQRLHLDRRTAQDFLAKTGLWQTSRQQWRVRLNTLTPTVRKKVTTEPKGDTE